MCIYSSYVFHEHLVKSNSLTYNLLDFQMAMFAALGDKFICGILKQIAADYSLDYKEMKSRYTGAKSFEEYGPSDHTRKELEELDLDTEPEIAPVKAKKAPKSPKASAEKTKEPKAPKKKEAPKAKPKAKAPEPKGDAPMALSKMKKQDLIDELEEQGIDTDKLTVAKLKELVKGAREKSGVVTVRGGRKPKAVKEVPVHNHEPLTEEPVDDCELCNTHGDITETQVVTHEDFEVQNQAALEARLAEIMAEADADEEEEAEEDGDGMDELAEETDEE